MFFNLFKKKKENQKGVVSEPIKVETTPNPQPKVEVKQKTDGYYVALRLGYAWGFISPSTRLDTNDGFSNSLSNSTIGALSFDSLNEATQFVNKLFNTVLNRYDYQNRKGIEEFDEVPSMYSDEFTSKFNVAKFYLYGFLSGGWYCTVRLMIVKEK